MRNSISIAIFDKNKNSGKVIKSYAEDMDFVSSINLYQDYSESFEFPKGGEDAVIIDISDGIDKIRDIMENVRRHTSKIIMTSTDYSTDTIIKALRLGAKEFLPKPVLKADLFRALSLLANTSEDETGSKSKIISIYSNKGGIGKTVIAVNLAAELAKAAKDKVALVDLNLQLGDISSFLNLSPAFDVNAVIRKLINKDETLPVQMFEKYKETSLYILSDPCFIEQSESIKPRQISLLFDALRKSFPYIVVDMSSNIDPNSLKILDCSDWILFTTIVNLPAIRNAQRCLNLLRSRRYPDDKVKIIINRFKENEDIESEDIENTLSEKIYWKLPNNYFTIMEAINKGVCVSEVNTESNIASSFRDLAIKISDDMAEQAVMRYRI